MARNIHTELWGKKKELCVCIALEIMILVLYFILGSYINSSRDDLHRIASSHGNILYIMFVSLCFSAGAAILLGINVLISVLAIYCYECARGILQLKREMTAMQIY